LCRNRPRASSASTSASVVPETNPASIARPDTPRMSLATLVGVADVERGVVPATCSGPASGYNYGSLAERPPGLQLADVLRTDRQAACGQCHYGRPGGVSLVGALGFPS
jgi:hypothetical protein